MDYVWLKVAFLLVTALLFHKGITPPNPPPSKNATVYKGRSFEHNVRAVALYADATIMTTVLVEVVVLVFGLRFPNAVPAVGVLCPAGSENDGTKLLTPTATFYGGVLCAVLGGLLRVWCYRSLGGLFTFEVTVLKDHELVTRGPYAYIRHPSYTAALLMNFGTQLVCFTPGGFVMECGMMETPLRLLVYVWWAASCYATAGMYQRGYVEDKQLYETFGQGWVDYKKAVPYMYLPYLL